MKTDILIAGVMVAFSIGTLLGIITIVARAVREEPRPVHVDKSPEPAPVLRPVSGW